MLFSHSMAPAGGDQLSAILGTWEDGLFPGIKTIDHIAEDVHDSHLRLPFDDIKIDPSSMPVGFVNSKGFEETMPPVSLYPRQKLKSF